MDSLTAQQLISTDTKTDIHFLVKQNKDRGTAYWREVAPQPGYPLVGSKSIMRFSDMDIDIPSHQSQCHSERLMYSSSKPRDYLYRLISYVVNQCRLHLRPSNSQIPSWLLPSSLVRGPRSLSLIGRPGILRFLTIIIKGLGSSGKKNSYLTDIRELV